MITVCGRIHSGAGEKDSLRKIRMTVISSPLQRWRFSLLWLILLVIVSCTEAV
ncbi:hypothetical protein X975_25437, partial [Stegodyphus mimosarum]